MDTSLPDGAAVLLDFIAQYEAPQGYDTIFGNNQRNLKKQITAMTLDELIGNQALWGRLYKSSAAGRYQFMPNTLQSLKHDLSLTGKEIFEPDFQDKLGYRLLIRRGFLGFVAKTLSTERFGLGLAQEWASFPVLQDTQGASRSLKRGQSYYSGDGLNKALVSSEKVEEALNEVLARASEPSKTTKSSEVTMSNTKFGTSPSIPTASDFAPKPWYLSKGVIGGIIAVAIPILSMFFPALRLVNPSDATDWIMKIIQIAGPIIGGLVAIFGRVKATQPIGNTNAATIFANAGLSGLSGPTSPPSMTPSLTDMSLNTLVADLPQVLLMIQNAGKLMGSKD